MTSCWKPDHEAYLRELSRVCETLSTRYNQEYDRFRRLEARFQLLAIVISSGLGVSAFGNNQFAPDTQRSLNIAMGIVGLGLGILNSVQSYLKIAATASRCLLTSANLQKLKESIDVELSINEADRSNSGIVFLREAYNDYEKFVDAAPAVLKRVRFVKAPLGGVVIERSDLGESSSIEV